MSKKAQIFICGKSIETQAGLVVGRDLIALANLNGSAQLLLERNDDIDIPIGATDVIVIDGGERFSISDGDPPIIDNPKLRRPIQFLMNGKLITKDAALEMPKLTGSKLKTFDPNAEPGDGLFAELTDLPDEPIGDSVTVVVQDKDRFITTPPGNVGEAAQERGLFSRHLKEAESVFGSLVVARGSKEILVICKALEVPSHWKPTHVDLLVRVREGYPITPLDMFYVDPPLSTADGSTPARAGTGYRFLGRNWQRFSWHYDRAWDPNHDTLLSHLRFCMARLQQAR